MSIEKDVLGGKTPISGPAKGRGKKVKRPKEDKTAKLLQQLTNCSAMLVFKVASCTCKDKANCEVYKKGQEIAQVIDKLNELRSQVKGVTPSPTPSIGEPVG